MAAWSLAALRAGSVLAGVGFVARQRRAPSPLMDLSLLRPAAVSVGLAGALCAYLVLFGPLTLFPQLFSALSDRGGAEGLLLAGLPIGFALAALTGDRLTPDRWTTRARGLAGAMTSALAAGALAAAPLAPSWVTAWLVVLGLGLGLFIPANNTAIMAAIPPRCSATGGAWVNMGCGLGTALEVAIVTLCLHLAPTSATPTGARLALAVVGILAAVTAHYAQPSGTHRKGTG